MNIKVLSCAVLLALGAALADDAPLAADSPPPVPVASANGAVAMVSEPNSLGERALLLRGGTRGEKLLLYLWKEGSLQGVCGEDGRLISPGFTPTELCWLLDDELACFSPQAAPLPPYGHYLSERERWAEERLPRRARLLLVQLQPGVKPPPLPPARGLFVHRVECEAYKGRVQARELRTEFAAGTSLDDGLHHSTPIASWSCGDSVAEAQAGEKTAPPDDSPALRALAAQALAAMQPARLGEISPANERGERVVT